MPDTKAHHSTYVTLEQLASASGLSQITLRRYVKSGKLEAFQPGGKRARLLFKPDVLERKAETHVSCESSTAVDRTTASAKLDDRSDVIEASAGKPRPDRRRRAHWRRDLPANNNINDRK